MGLLSFLLDIYENSRKTTTDVKDNKPKNRKYNFDTEFTGSKKQDYEIVNTSKLKKPKEKGKEDLER